MEVGYADKKLEKSCTDDRQMKKTYSAVVAKALQKRLVELEIADNMLALQDGIGKWHPLDGNYKGCWGASLNGNVRIVVSGVEAEEVEYQWELVSVVCVEEVTDYHDKKTRR